MIEKLLKELGTYKTTSNQYLFDKCPYCGKKHKFYMNTLNHLWDCKSCGENGNINKLLKKFGHEEIEIKKEEKGVIINPSDYSKAFDDKDVVEYFVSRGISQDTLAKTNTFVNKLGNISFFTFGEDYLLSVTHRSIKDKRFGMEANSEQYLWNRESLDFDYDFIIIAEGHIDALTAIEMGFENVVSMPNGCNAQKWIDNEYELLRNFNKIFLLYDNDKSGKKSLEQSMQRLDKFDLYTMDYGDYKDLNDFYMAESKKCYEALTNPVRLTSDSVVDITEVNSTSDTANKTFSSGISQLDHMFNGFRNRELTIISAKAGCVDKHTQFFNGKVWKSMEHYIDGESVLQYNPFTNSPELVKPTFYFKRPNKFFFQIRKKYINIVATLDHNLALFDKDIKLYVVKMENFINNIEDYKDLYFLTDRGLIDMIGVRTFKVEEEGYKYCFSVPSEFLILKRFKTYFVIGNSGKTTLVSNMIAHDVELNRKVFYYSGELSDETLKTWIYNVFSGGSGFDEFDNKFRKGEKTYRLKPEVEKKIDKWIKGKLYINKGGVANAFKLIERMEEFHSRYGIQTYYIDNKAMMDFSGEKISNKYEAESEFTKRLNDFIRKNDVRVFLIVHPSKTLNNDETDFLDKKGRVKPPSRIGLHNVSGSSDLTNLAHNVLCVYRVNEHWKEFLKQSTPIEGMDFEDASTVLELVKSRNGGFINEDVVMRLDHASKRFYSIMDTKLLDMQFGYERDEINEKIFKEEFL